MKLEIERNKPRGVADHSSLAITTCGVGYLPLAPGTWGSMVGVGIYLGAATFISKDSPLTFAAVLIAVLALCLIGMWASSRAVPLLGNTDPSEAVIDEVIGQIITFLFIPFGVSWGFVLLGFLLFRLFDIIKPYPIDALQVLPGGVGICADDILAGIYAGISLAVIYAGYLYFFVDNAIR